jgi:hypothetical protein
MGHTVNQADTYSYIFNRLLHLRTELREMADKCEIEFTDDVDVRVGWEDGCLHFAHGDVSYDTRHWPVCVANMISPIINNPALRSVARDMCTQLRAEIAALDDE